MSMTVRVRMFPGTDRSVLLEDGATLKTAIETAEMNPSGNAIQINGIPTADLSTPVNDGDVVVMSASIKGN